jgi:hypothetical protein
VRLFLPTQDFAAVVRDSTVNHPIRKFTEHISVFDDVKRLMRSQMTSDPMKLRWYGNDWGSEACQPEKRSPHRSVNGVLVVG